MIKHVYTLVVAIFLSAYSLIAYGQTSNDHMFPASAMAKPFIDFDSKGFLVNGKRTFVVSAGLEYARIPHELWYDRLLRIKRAGFNCIEIYTFWNFHEPKENEFDFTGDHDLGLFLATVKKLDMYAIVRVGPYYCAEWDNGGYPLWLKFKKGLRVREDNKVFKHYVDRFFDRLLPIVFRQQINNGGPVILVQLENEHPKAWGTITPDGYFKHLQAKALSLGLKVPYFFSGLHHSSDPAEDGKVDDPARPNPWFSTEFWSVWYSQYGAKPGDAGLFDRRTWKIIARGGNGYNYYMVHGGSNFGYTNNDEDAASYDYGAAVGQAGDLRPIYYTFKRAAWFARSFQDVLENGIDATGTYRKIITDTAIKITARTSPSGDIVFLDNPGEKPAQVGLANSRVHLTIAPGEIYPLVQNFKIAPGIMLDRALIRIFAVVKQQNTTTIITDGEKGADISLHFIAGANQPVTSQSAAIKIDNGNIYLDAAMPEIDKPLEYIFTVGTQTIRILAMNRKWTDKTWITDAAGKTCIISGTYYFADVESKGKNLMVETEKPLLSARSGPVWLYTDKAAILMSDEAVPEAKQPEISALSKWEQKVAITPASAGFNAASWVHSKGPLQMGADGDITADAWYRTKLTIPVDGNYTIQVKGNGRGRVFIDGKPDAAWNLDDEEVLLSLKKGRHTLAIFTAHDGRDKLPAFIGAIHNVDSKGIFGEALIKQGGPFISELNNWYFAKAARRDDIKQGPPTFDTIVLKKYKIGDDAFNLKEGYGWFETVIDKLPAGTSKLILSFKSVDENATVFINNKLITHQDGWNVPFEVTFADAQALKGALRIAVFIENYSNEGGIDQPVKINTIGNATVIANWAMKGGVNYTSAATHWQPVSVNKTSNAGPCFYRSKFSISFTSGKTNIWRIDPKNMGHGSIWVNGYNIGRYPEKIATPGLYIPECWLKNGMNELLIYDEDGQPPVDAIVVAEPGAGRTKNKLTAIIN